MDWNCERGNGAMTRLGDKKLLREVNSLLLLLRESESLFTLLITGWSRTKSGRPPLPVRKKE